MEDKYNFQQTEEQLKSFWLTSKIFSFDPNAVSSKRPLFSIDTPPPTVSGALHIGHIFSYTQADIIARFARMNGHEVFYPFGFDDNGIATERFVEKKRKISPFAVGRSEFIKACLEETALAEEQFKQLWEAVGLSVDWSHWYSTISPHVRKISQESFVLLHRDGRLYRKHEPALYCTACRTTVAQAELEDKEINTQFCDLLFTLSDGKPLRISTTRPELISSCVALFYNPRDERYRNLVGKKAIVPHFGYEVPVLADELVDPEKGTGLVMCCTFGDKNDILWFKKHNLPYRQSIGLDGKWRDDTGLLAGLTAQKAREVIVHKLVECGALVNQRPLLHVVNVHERCKKEIEYLIINQWFINILDHKKDLLALADKIEWYPHYMKTRYINWVENLGWDWCISRQRFFGIPFPVWHCDSCDYIAVAGIDQLPVDPQETPYNKACPSCGKNMWRPETDVMDTWSTSALTPYICCSLISDNKKSVFETAPEFLPMSMRPQAHDIIRTWAFYTIAKTWFHSKTIPWRSIVISGHVLSSAAEKISKSQGNAPIDPHKLVTQWSADAVRFWTASATLGTDTAFSENQIKIGQRTVTKLWNAFKFLRTNTSGVLLVADLRPKQLLNKWLLHEVTATYMNYCAHLEKKEFGLALHQIETFFWGNFCDNYLECVKPQLFKPEEYAAEDVEETKQTLFVVGLRILQLYAPYMPFITEKIYQSIYRSVMTAPSIHRTLFADVQQSYHNVEDARVITQVLAVVSAVRKLKSTHQVSLAAEMHELVLYTTDDAIKKIVQDNSVLIKGVVRAKQITLSSQPVETGVDTIASGMVMRLNLNEQQA